MAGTKYRNFGGSGKPFSRRPPMPREDCTFKGEKIKNKQELDAYLSGSAIQCLICGEYFVSVSSHVFNKHGVKVSDYKEEFGIPKNTGVITKELKTRLSESWEEIEGMDKRKMSGDVDEYITKKLSDFVLFTTNCNKNKISIYKASNRKSSDIHVFIGKYAHKELVKLVAINKEYSYHEKETVHGVCSMVGCENVTRRFGSESDNCVDVCCSYECAAKLKKSKRIKKACRICGGDMFLTKGNYKRISSCCGSRVKKSAKGSAVNTNKY